MFVGFGATAQHCALYLRSTSTVEAHKNELKDYDTSKGTIRLQAEKPLLADRPSCARPRRLTERPGSLMRGPPRRLRNH